MALKLNLPIASPVEGVELVTVAAGIKSDGSSDMVMARLDERTRCAAVFTKSSFCAAPVTVCRQHLAMNSGAIRGLLINSGNANAGTGHEGIAMAQGHCEALGTAMSVAADSILPFSTGVIGQLLPDRLMRDAIAKAGAELQKGSQQHCDKSAWESAARGIMTTDTQAKLTTQSFSVDGETITLTGMAKGSGMIQPDMATLLSYVFTDAAIDSAALNKALRNAMSSSFNAITVDSDTSTNDSCVLMATGCRRRIDENGPGWQAFNTALKQICLDLAQAIVRDAEGASKFISVRVEGGKSVDECRMVGYAVANSPLVKTAMFASDANVGRLLMAIGKTDIPDLDPALVRVSLGDVLVFEAAGIATGYTEERGAAVMAADDIEVLIELGRGDSTATIYTSDLSHDYVSINADYRS